MISRQVINQDDRYYVVTNWPLNGQWCAQCTFMYRQLGLSYFAQRYVTRLMSLIRNIMGITFYPGSEPGLPSTY